MLVVIVKELKIKTLQQQQHSLIKKTGHLSRKRNKFVNCVLLYIL